MNAVYTSDVAKDEAYNRISHIIDESDKDLQPAMSRTFEDLRAAVRAFERLMRQQARRHERKFGF
jgi:hypothetical protein